MQLRARGQSPQIFERPPALVQLRGLIDHTFLRACSAEIIVLSSGRQDESQITFRDTISGTWP